MVAGVEVEVPLEDLVESVSPSGSFDPQQWLYEQVCLSIPQRQLCDKDCSGLDPDIIADSNPVDSRWAALASLKKQLSE